MQAACARDECTDRPGPRLACASAVLGDELLLFGGWDPQTPGTGGESQRVLASAVATLLPSGALAAPTLLDVRLPAGAASAVLSVNSSQPALQLVRWQVVSRGCEDTQQATGDVATLVL